MNLSKIKTYAPQARKDFIAAVTRRASVFGLRADGIDEVVETGDVAMIAGHPFPRSILPQRKRIAERIRLNGFDQTMEAMAYTWFNRFAALRFMELHGYLEHGYRILSHPENGNLPEILQHAEHLSIDGLDSEEVIRLKLAGNKDEELYRLLIIAECNELSRSMPFIFNRIDDETSLLLPDNLLHSDSLVRKLVCGIDEADWEPVEIIGWLYQFYISEKKDAVMGRKAAVPKEDIPAVTQLFTPHWIVRYLVENSLGRLWLLNRPQSRLRQQMPYYIEGEPETDFLKIGKPEEIRLVDPACGSGHMLTYAFDLLYAIYEEEGYDAAAIPSLILRHNLHGLEICDRAAALASFALCMKARSSDRRFFRRLADGGDDAPRPRIIELKDVRFAENDLRDYIQAMGLGDLFNQPMLELLHQFEEAKNFGSLIQPCLDEQNIAFARRAIAVKDLGDQLFLNKTHVKVLRVLEQAEALTQRYQVVVANPPYMGSKPMNTVLQRFVERQFDAGKADLYGAFMLRNAELVRDCGYVGMITIPNWMFLVAFEELRKWLISKLTVKSLVHNGRGVWGPDFGSCAFVYKRHPAVNVRGSYKRLFEKQGEVNSNDELIRRFLDNETFPTIQANQAEYAKIPGIPIAYWVSSSTRRAFEASPSLEQFAPTRKGMVTADNETYVRLWFELGEENIGFNCSDRKEALDSGRKWFPYLKGGGFRKWYGNSSTVVDWQNDGHRLRTARHPTEDRVLATNFNLDYIFKPNVNWGAVTISAFSARISAGGEMFDAGGSACFPPQQHIFGILAFLNSVLTSTFLSALNPTLNFQAGNISNLPFILSGNKTNADLAETAVGIARADWDNFETSWDFRDQPLLRSELKGATLEASWQNWEAQSNASIRRMQQLETENNRLFIAAYGLDGELQPEVPEEQITLARPDAYKDIAAFISYAVGCMMGRYSLDVPGLILANQGENLEAYSLIHNEKLGWNIPTHENADPCDLLEATTSRCSFLPDWDGIIPVLDAEWFPDDIVARFKEFLRVTFGNKHEEENVRFVEESLGKDLRSYFLTDFYKNHLSGERAYGYKKRPIYWLFSSGKQKAFQALVYLHRYTPGTLARMRTEYVIPLQGKLIGRMTHLEDEIVSAASSAQSRKLQKERDTLVKQQAELLSFDERLRHYADQQISLDLDDGVKVNYAKFGSLLAEVKAVTGGSEE